MSNQQYRKEPPEPLTREARLVAARARIEAEASKGKTFSEALNKYLQTQYAARGGKEIDSQIEGMMLVIEEGKIYRRKNIAYQTQMDEWLEGKREREPYEPEKAAISGATMVSASRQLGALSERRERLLEDIQLSMAAQLGAIEAKKAKPAETTATGETPPPEPPPKQPQPEKEATPTKEDKRAATAAA